MRSAVLLALLLAGTIEAQSATFTGRVSTDGGAPLNGANVFIEGVASAFSTADGTYRLTTAASGREVILRVRAIGHTSQQRTVVLTPGAQQTDFTLRRDVARLDEVVVTGTIVETEVKKLPFSVTRLDSTDMPVASVNPLRQLQGKIPGANIVTPSGRPGVATAIVLRGPKSLDATGRSQSPLIMVDGVFVNAGLQEISAEDIETIEVINGSAAASIYGSRAGAGVIQINTKRAKAQGTRLSVRSEVGFSEITGDAKNSTRHTLMLAPDGERFCIRSVVQNFTANQPLCARSVDWDEEVARINEVPTSWTLSARLFERDLTGATATRPELKGLFQVNPWPSRYNTTAQLSDPQLFANTTVSLSSRVGNTGYFGSLSHLEEDGAIRMLRGYRRGSARLNLDHAVTDRWSLSLNSSYAQSVQGAANSGGPGPLDDEDFFQATRLPGPVNLRARDSRGRLYARPNPLGTGGERVNILYEFENQKGSTNVDRFLTSAQTRFFATSWLSLEGQGSLDRRRASGSLFLDKGYRTLGQAGAHSDGHVELTSSVSQTAAMALGARASFTRGTDWQGIVTTRYTYDQEDIATSSQSGQGLIIPGIPTLSNATANLALGSSAMSIRGIAALAGAQVQFRERYIVDGLYRHDGSSLFGARERWHAYSRGSVAWRVSEETFYPSRLMPEELKLRASVGTAGGRPAFNAQYETFLLAAGGQLTANRQQGNEDLRPETTLETEFGIDAAMRGASLTVNYARDITRDQLLQVPSPASTGFVSQWLNAGSLDGKTWELAVRLPEVRLGPVSWTSRYTWDRNRTYITAFDREPFLLHMIPSGSNNGIRLWYAPGVRYGTIRGWTYATTCAELPAPFDGQCGPGREWQHNDEGLVVWVGSGNSPEQGITRNLWQSVRPGCVGSATADSAVTATQCAQAGGTLNSPWGIETHWGMPTLLRDAAGQPAFSDLGSMMPDYRVSTSHRLRWRRLSIYGLVDASIGAEIFNQERQWSYLLLSHSDVDQHERSPGTAKPVGYYWRVGRPENATGVGGLYGQLVANNRTVEDGSYAKLRELGLSLDVRVPRAGAWTMSLVGRNLFTWTRYRGWDPEGGIDDGPAASAALTGGGFFQYPQVRTFTISLAGSP